MGYESVKAALKYEYIDDDLRVAIYNVVFDSLHGYYSDNTNRQVCKSIWSMFWHLPLDSFPAPAPLTPSALSDYDEAFFKELKKRLADDEWYKAYDLIEFIAKQYQSIAEKEELEVGMPTAWTLDEPVIIHAYSYLEDFTYNANKMLAFERAGYRLIDSSIAPITNKEEIESIEKVIARPDSLSGAKRHIRKALELFSAKQNPDYENVIKESISAVESAFRVFSGNDKHTLSQAIKTIKPNKVIHPTLLDAWDKLYAFTSDASGVRHGFKGAEDEIDGALAKYYLVSCSAILNLLISIDSNSLQ